jgi:hypothetical protein
MNFEFYLEQAYQNPGDVTTYWHGTGGWLRCVRNAVDDDQAFSIVLSKVVRDLITLAGPDETTRILLDLADAVDRGRYLE